MQEIWEKHKGLLKTALILCVAIIVYGVVLVVSEFQEITRERSATETIEINAYKGYDSYNVEGLTEEEIDELLERVRNNK